MFFFRLSLFLSLYLHLYNYIYTYNYIYIYIFLVYRLFLSLLFTNKCSPSQKACTNYPKTTYTQLFYQLFCNGFLVEIPGTFSYIKVPGDCKLFAWKRICCTFRKKLLSSSEISHFSRVPVFIVNALPITLSK